MTKASEARRRCVLKRLRMGKEYNVGKAVCFGGCGGYGRFSVTVAVPARLVTIAKMAKGGGKGENAEKVEKAETAKIAENERARVHKIAA